MYKNIWYLFLKGCKKKKKEEYETQTMHSSIRQNIYYMALWFDNPSLEHCCLTELSMVMERFYISAVPKW